MEKHNSNHQFNPQLGAGPFVEYKNWVAMFPFYSLKENDDTQFSLKASFGFGYRF